MKLSVIVPVYKAEDYLNACVDSLLNQSLRDMEIILVNDGSPDRSGEIMADYAARYPGRVIALSQPNGGQGRARNLGMGVAQGEYLGFVDSDDVVTPRMYETLCALADAAQADIVDCGLEALYRDGSTEAMTAWRDNRPIAAAGSACNKIFRRSFVGETRFPEGLKYEDFGFTAELLLRGGKLIHSPEILYRYRVGQVSTMHNEDCRMNLDLLEILEGVREHMDPVRDRDDFEFLVLNHLLIDAIKRVQAMPRSRERTEVLRLLRAYAHREIPRLGASASFRAESRSRRLIMRLHYRGLEDVAALLLAWKKRLR